MSTKLTLQICYGFYREWSRCKDYMDIFIPNTFQYHLADNRAFQIRDHLDRRFPKWMLEACYKMDCESRKRYEWQVQESIEDHRQHLKRKRLGLAELEDIPF